VEDGAPVLAGGAAARFLGVRAEAAAGEDVPGS